MSVRSEKAPSAETAVQGAIVAAQGAAEPLAEGQGFSAADPETPLTRNLVVSIRSSLHELCLQKQRGNCERGPAAEPPRTAPPSAPARRAQGLRHRKRSGLFSSSASLPPSRARPRLRGISSPSCCTT